MIQNEFQLRGGLLAFGLPPRCAHLQVLCGDAVIAVLRCFQKAKNGI